MEWSQKNSIFLTKLCISIFITGYAFVVLACPLLVKWFTTTSYTAGGTDEKLFITTIYACALPIGVLLYRLMKLVNNIGGEEIFTSDNISHLRVISWMCFGVAVVCFLSMGYYLLFGVLGCCMALMGLLIRVIKNAFDRAKQLKDENDYTI